MLVRLKIHIVCVDEVLEADPPASTIQEAAFDQFIDQMLSEPIIEIFDAKSHPQSPHSPTTLIVATPPRKNNKRYSNIFSVFFVNG